MASYSSPENQAIRTVCGRNFHQTLWLPETATHQKLRVTYATTTNFDNVSLPVILYISQMYATRWGAVFCDRRARRYGVRVICVDRPGFGGSTPVGINIRMQVWLETVPALLQRLDVKHVSIVTHSAGAIYTLNTLLHHRSILDPKAPYVAFLAPWVPTVHSRATLMTIAAKLPTNLLSSYVSLMTFMSTKFQPGAAWSGEIILSSAARVSSSATPLSSPASTHPPEAETSNSTTPLEQKSYDKYVADLIWKLASKYSLAESLKGANEEAKLCLRKCDEADWGEATYYSKCISKIALNEATLSSNTHNGLNAAKLSVDAFFGSKDVMIGKRGQEYFEDCWQTDEVATNINFMSWLCPNANHDDVLIDHKKGAMKIVFKKISQLHKRSYEQAASAN